MSKPFPPPPPISLLQPGDVGLDSGGSPLSWAIKTKTWSDVSHAWLFVGQARDIPVLADHHPADSYWVISAERRSLVGKWLKREVDRHDGVNYYPLDLRRTLYVLRAKDQVWDRETALALFETDCSHGRCRGSGYDTFGLMKSFYGRRFHRTDTAGFCSEATRQALEWGKVFVFPETYEIDATPPCAFNASVAMGAVWKRGS